MNERIQEFGSQSLALRTQHAALLIAALCAFASLRETVFAQTNGTSSTSVATNMPSVRLPAPSDFQRLQYYYAAQTSSPAPGTERSIFTLKGDRTWSGDWNSKAVSKPTRAQLETITAQQVDLFRRAAVYTNGAWRITTSRTNIPLATLNVTASDYPRLRAIVDLYKAEQQVERAEKVLEAMSEVPATESE